jgi:hypothetical protein
MKDFKLLRWLLRTTQSLSAVCLPTSSGKKSRRRRVLASRNAPPLVLGLADKDPGTSRSVMPMVSVPSSIPDEIARYLALRKTPTLKNASKPCEVS